MDAAGITAVFLKSIFSGIKKGDCVGFGRYCQENSSEKTPIEWLALQTSGTTVLLISRCALDCKPYQAYYKEDMTWENCDLRAWLNGEFLRNAFTGEEQKMIALSKLANDDNPEYGTSGGNTTEDRVFCLSLAEAETLFESRDARKCIPTPYAVKQGADKYGISRKAIARSTAEPAAGGGCVPRICLSTMLRAWAQMAILARAAISNAMTT